MYQHMPLAVADMPVLHGSPVVLCVHLSVDLNEHHQCPAVRIVYELYTCWGTVRKQGPSTILEFVGCLFTAQSGLRMTARSSLFSLKFRTTVCAIQAG